MSTPNLARLIFLAAECNPELPPKHLVKLIPQFDIIEAVAKAGVTGAAEELDIPVEQIKEQYTIGKDSGKGSDEEFRLLLGQTMLAETDLRRDQVTMSTYLGQIRDISNYVEKKNLILKISEEVDLGSLSEDEAEIQKIPKWDTGFTPFDFVTGGFYQAITTLIARPGHGKTSLMISIMEEARRINAASSLWYYELEIPRTMMMYRVAPSAARVRFLREKDRLIVGPTSIEEIEREIHACPDENRIIFIDSPDVMAGGSGDKKRFAIEEVYMGLIRLKTLSKAVFVSSWPRRNDRTITLESGAEAWSKAWYSDIIIGASKLGRAGMGMNSVKLNVVKNRFGRSDSEVTFRYNYADLSWEAPAVMADEGDDW